MNQDAPVLVQGGRHRLLLAKPFLVGSLRRGVQSALSGVGADLGIVYGLVQILGRAFVLFAAHGGTRVRPLQALLQNRFLKLL